MVQHPEETPSSTSAKVLQFIKKTHNRLFKDASLQEMQTKLDTLLNDSQRIDVMDVLDKKIRGCKLVDGITSTSRNSASFHDHIYHDVEFFQRFPTTGDDVASRKAAVFDIINQCQTIGGSQVSKEVYTHPSSDLNMLYMRTTYLQHIKNVYQDKEKRKDIDGCMEVMKEKEKYIAWIFEEKEENLKELYDLVFFRLKGLQPLNHSSSSLTMYNFYRIFISPIFGIVAPIMYFLIPYIIILYRFKIKLPFKEYLKTIVYSVFNSEDTILGSGKHYKYIRLASYLFSAVFYFQGIFSSVDLAKTVHKMSKLVTNSLSGAIEYVKSAHKLNGLLWDVDKVSSFVNANDYTLFHNFVDEGNYVATLSAPNFNVFSNFGKQLKTYKFLDLDIVKSIVCKSYTVDALLGAVRFTENQGCTVCEYDNGKEPMIHLQDMGHPCIEPQKAVLNSITLGKGVEEANAIITSPNSSGKSILIKSLIVNVLMAQTMGITSSRKARLTPFNFVNTQINVPDSTGHESLFEAEMHRCKYNLDVLKKIHEPQPTTSHNNKLSLIVMDEIFNSTNPVEAVAGAYAVCKKLASYSTNMLIFTTHFNYLTKLAKAKELRFVNWRMQTSIANDGVIDFTYKLERGVNKHLLALELLRLSGFEDDLLEEAIKIKNELVQKVSNKKNDTKLVPTSAN